jgi:hypothetical protein
MNNDILCVQYFPFYIKWLDGDSYRSNHHYIVHFHYSLFILYCLILESITGEIACLWDIEVVFTS